MMKLLVGLAAGLIACAAVAAAVGEDGPKPGRVTVKGTGLQINHGLDRRRGYAAPTTALTFLVIGPGKQFLGLLDESSKVTAFKDDRGTNLLKDKGFGAPFFVSEGILGPGLDRVRVSIRSPVPPARGATKLHLRGKLVLLCGVGAKTTEARDVEFKDNNEVKFGSLTLKVDQEEPVFPGGGAFFSITSPRPIVKSVTVKDAGGKEVAVRLFSCSGSDKTWTAAYTLKKPLKKGKVSITLFTREEKLTVPIDLNIGVGL